MDLFFGKCGASAQRAGPAGGRYFDPAVFLARISNLTLRGRRHVVEGIMAGLHRSALRGLSVEFAELRAYAPGDELRASTGSSWAAGSLLRQGVRGRDENARWLFVGRKRLDGLRRVQRGRLKLEYASYIAASLAYLMLLQRERGGVSLSWGRRPQDRPAALPGRITCTP